MIMLAFMLGMYSNKKLNMAIFLLATILFAICLYLVRSQSTISDTAYMKAIFLITPLLFLLVSIQLWRMYVCVNWQMVLLKPNEKK